MGTRGVPLHAINSAVAYRKIDAVRHRSHPPNAVRWRAIFACKRSWHVSDIHPSLRLRSVDASLEARKTSTKQEQGVKAERWGSTRSRNILKRSPRHASITRRSKKRRSNSFTGANSPMACAASAAIRKYFFFFFSVGAVVRRVSHHRRNGLRRAGRPSKDLLASRRTPRPRFRPKMARGRVRRKTTAITRAFALERFGGEIFRAPSGSLGTGGGRRPRTHCCDFSGHSCEETREDTTRSRSSAAGAMRHAWATPPCSLVTLPHRVRVSIEANGNVRRVYDLRRRRGTRECLRAGMMMKR